MLSNEEWGGKKTCFKLASLLISSMFGSISSVTNTLSDWFWINKVVGWKVRVTSRIQRLQVDRNESENIKFLLSCGWKLHLASSGRRDRKKGFDCGNCASHCACFSVPWLINHSGCSHQNSREATALNRPFNEVNCRAVKQSITEQCIEINVLYHCGLLSHCRWIMCHCSAIKKHYTIRRVENKGNQAWWIFFFCAMELHCWFSEHIHEPHSSILT